MDYNKMLMQLGESLAIVLLLVAFIVVLTLLMISLGPQAAPSPKMTCDIVNATTFCHF